MLDIQSDPNSKGELFHAFRERFMSAATDGDGQAIYDVAAGAPGEFAAPGTRGRARPMASRP